MHAAWGGGVGERGFHIRAGKFCGAIEVSRLERSLVNSRGQRHETSRHQESNNSYENRWTKNYLQARGNSGTNSNRNEGTILGIG
jgi:hypothetical protein